MTQPTMEGINQATPNSAAPLDLTTPESEAAKAAAAEELAQKRALQEDAAGSPTVIDGVTPGPASPKPPTEAKTPTFALTPEPSKPAEELAPKAITTQAPLGSSPTDIAAAPQATQVADQPTKKPGFFGKLFGKK